MSLEVAGVGAAELRLLDLNDTPVFGGGGLFAFHQALARAAHGRRHGRVQPVHGVRRRLSGKRAAGWAERTAAALHRKELRAVWPVRTGVPGKCHHAGAWFSGRACP